MNPSSPLHLTVMIGPGVPLPVSRDVIEAITSVEVTHNTEGPSVFQLSFSLSKRSPLHTIFLLAGGSPVPLIRVVLVVTVGGITEVLVDGLMTHHQVGAGSDGQVALTVTGEDKSKLMTYIPFNGLPYPAMPREARVLLILAKYAAFGVIPLVIPSVLPDVPIPISRIPAHQGTDLEYVKRLADEVGYVFYMDPTNAPGVSTAYWGPEIRVGIPQKALTHDSPPHTNVDSLSFRYDSEKKKLPILLLQEELSKVFIPIPIPDVNPLSPPLGLLPAIPKGIELTIGTGGHSIPQAIMVGLAKAAKSADVVFGSGSLDVLRYGQILKARQLVGVRGAGDAFDGLHFVKSVTHQIQRGSYKQRFSLARNALLSNVPSVPS